MHILKWTKQTKSVCIRDSIPLLRNVALHYSRFCSFMIIMYGQKHGRLSLPMGLNVQYALLFASLKKTIVSLYRGRSTVDWKRSPYDTLGLIVDWSNSLLAQFVLDPIRVWPNLCLIQFAFGPICVWSISVWPNLCLIQFAFGPICVWSNSRLAQFVFDPIRSWPHFLFDPIHVLFKSRWSKLMFRPTHAYIINFMAQKMSDRNAKYAFTLSINLIERLWLTLVLFGNINSASSGH
jgi:hypothetical protein